MRLAIIFILLPILGFTQPSKERFKLPAGIKPSEYVPNRVWVKLKAGYHDLFQRGPSSIPTPIANIGGIKPIVPVALQKKAILRNAPRLARKQVDVSLLYEIGFDGNDIEGFINKLKATGYFDVVEPEYVNHLLFEPDDPSTFAQYYLTNIKAFEAWDISQGSSDIIIAIVDSGGDLDHPDLINKLYTNPNDTVDGIDNDNDGFIDNYQGWDFMSDDVSNASDLNFIGDNDPNTVVTGSGSHGTSVAGCAGAEVNNAIGIAGVGFNSRLMFTKHSADNQSPSEGAIYRGYSGIIYAAEHGAKIINTSWGGTFRSQIAQDIITYVTLDLGSLVVAAAGNSGSDDPFYPASYDYVLSVAASDNNNIKASFSNFGQTVDLTAPGKGISTTSYNDSYTNIDGTSFASPITAGAAALVLAKNPTFTPLQIAEQLRVTADPAIYSVNPAGLSKKLGKGLLDVHAALTLELPSIRASRPKLLNASGTIAEPGQQAFLSMDFTNFLKSSSSGLQISVTPVSSTWVTVTQGTIHPGTISENSTINNKLNPFEMMLSAFVPENTVIELVITYTDGSYSDFQYLSFIINPTYIDIDDNQTLTTLASNGRIGFEDPDSGTNGQGFVFDENSILYEMGLIMGTSPSSIINNVRGINDLFDQDFTVIQKIKEISPGERSFSEIFGTIGGDTMEVRYRSLVWKEEPYDKFVILEYKVKNVSGQAISDFHFGIFADWDISGSGQNDKAKWDNDNSLGYVYPATSVTLPHAGIKLLKGIAPGYFAIDNDINLASGSFGIYDGYTDNEKFTSISSDRLEAGNSDGDGNDVSHVVSAGPYNLAVDEEITIAFALLGGLDLDDLKNSALHADTLYNLTLSAPQPIVNEAEACLDTPATLTATGASNFNWYKSFTGGESFFTGNQFVTANLENDTTFFVSNADNSYESVRTAAKAIVKANPTILSGGSGTICDGTSITLSVAEADSYFWSPGGETTQTITVTTVGNYTVQVTDTTLSCNSSSPPFEVIVNPSPTADFTIDSPELFINQPIQFSSTSTGATSFLWAFGDNTTSTEENPTHTYTQMLNYNVTLTTFNGFGCQTSSTQSISVITGLENQPDNEFLVFPVPAEKSITIQSEWMNLEFDIIDPQGKVYYAEKYSGSSPFIKELSLQHFSNGLYLIRARDGNKTVIKKIIKN